MKIKHFLFILDDKQSAKDRKKILIDNVRKNRYNIIAEFSFLV